MQYVNLHISVLTGAEFVGSDPLDRATWICLMTYCCLQENGGIIEDCANWADRRWQQLARVTSAEVRRTSELWKWVGEDLEVNFYPEKQEKQTRSMRKGGEIGNRKRWGKKGKQQSPPDSPPDGSENGTGDSPPDSPPESIIQSKLSKAKLTEAPRVVNLEQAIAWMDENASGYSHDQIREQWLYYDAMRHPETGAWQKPRGNLGVMVPITDWRSELAGALQRFGEKKAAAVNPSVQAYTDNKRRAELMAELQELEEEIESRHQAGAEIPAEKKAREREIRKELAK
jgi:hypothetical protein